MHVYGDAVSKCSCDAVIKRPCDLQWPSAHVMQGLQCTTLFCGDGINDLSALAAADVSMAIGATDAFVAASVTTPKMSIAGMHCNTPCLATRQILLLLWLFLQMVVSCWVQPGFSPCLICS